MNMLNMFAFIFLQVLHKAKKLDVMYFWSRRLCLGHQRWCLQCLAGLCYYQLLLFFFSLRILLSTHFGGISRV